MATPTTDATKSRNKEVVVNVHAAQTTTSKPKDTSVLSKSLSKS